eukprot:COSAG01_NODE_6606_length_3587_cov_21.769805_1_plen_347_part_00
MSDIKEVPAPRAGLLTARSPGREPSAQYITFLDEGGELISVPNFDFTDEALMPAIEVLKNRPFDILAAAIDESRLAASEARAAIDDIFDKDEQRAAARALLAECLERPNNRFVFLASQKPSQLRAVAASFPSIPAADLYKDCSEPDRACRLTNRIYAAQEFNKYAPVQDLVDLFLVAFIRAYRRRLRALGLHTTGDDPVYHKQWTYNTPQRGHSLTNALGYSDDTALACTSWPAGWFAQIHYLMAKFEWGIPVGFKPGKTDPVSKTALWIGYLFNCAAMSVALHEERLLKMRVKLRPFSSDPDVAQLARSGGPTVADARNLLGVLIFLPGRERMRIQIRRISGGVG